MVYEMGGGERMEKVYNKVGGQGCWVSIVQYGERRRVEDQSVVEGKQAILWVTLLKVEGGAISKRANRPFAGGVWVGSYRMSNAWVMFEMEGRGRTNRMGELIVVYIMHPHFINKPTP